MQSTKNPLISALLFFDISDPHGSPVTGAKLTADGRHEIWLESTGGRLQDLEGRLRIGPVEVAPAGAAQLTREALYGYAVDLRLEAAEREALRVSQSQTERLMLVLEFDVTYDEGYESPGGYSAAYGIHYWDDVAFPRVAAVRSLILPHHEAEDRFGLPRGPSVIAG